MDNIIDYVKQNHLTFDKQPFNTADAMVFAQLAYYDYAGFVSGIKPFAKRIRLCDIVKHPHWERIVCIGSGLDMKKEFFFNAAKSGRFGKCQLLFYEDDYDDKEHKQFSALTFYINKKLSVASFRGTDSTVIGWKEDFDMMYKKTIPSQDKSAEYLNRTALLHSRSIICTGHSKGGNLAVYAASKCVDIVKKRIRRVYNFDGPGFKRDFYQDKGYEDIRNKITTIVPRSSVIGLLFGATANCRAVQSDGAGLDQHSMFNWHFMQGRLMYVEQISKDALVFNKILDDWIKMISFDDRKRLVNTLYYAAAKSKAVSLNDIKNYWPDPAAFLKEVLPCMNKDTKDFLKSMLNKFLDCAKLRLKDGITGELTESVEKLRLKIMKEDASCTPHSI